MRIDVHAHYWTDDYLDRLVELGQTDTADVAASEPTTNIAGRRRERQNPQAWLRGRMWYDTVGHGHVPALKCAIESFAWNGSYSGTDFPYESGDTFVRAVEYINDAHVDRGRRPSYPRPERRCTARDGVVVSYESPRSLASRHHLQPDLATRLDVLNSVTDASVAYV